MSDVENPIFIGGVNRSGTSMVRQVLGSHPDVAIPPSEFEFFKHLDVRTRARLTPVEVGDLIDTIFGWPKIAAWGIDRERVQHEALEANSYRGIFLAFLRSYARKTAKPRFGDKTTSYERYLSTLDRWFERDYTFVHVMRHPVTTFASTRWYQGRERHIDPRVWSRHWNGSAMTALREMRAARRRYVAMRYEDIVRDPEREIALVCLVAGLPFNERMLAMEAFEQRENSSFETVGADYSGAIRSHDDVIRATRIPESDLRVVRAQCRVLASAFGYDVNDEHATASLTAPRRAAELRFRMSFAAGSTAARVRQIPPKLASRLVRTRVSST